MYFARQRITLLHVTLNAISIQVQKHTSSNTLTNYLAQGNVRICNTYRPYQIVATTLPYPAICAKLYVRAKENFC